MLITQRLMLLWASIQTALVLLMQDALSLWMSAVYLLLLVLVIAQQFSRAAGISLKLANLIAACITLALVFSVKQSGVLYFMLQILLLAAISRLLAMKHAHEARQLIWVHYFLIACCFILHQDMAIAVLIFTIFAANFYSQHKLFSANTASLQLKSVGRAAMIILPLWLGMFVLFPRLPPFWQLPNMKAASTGLSDTLEPGAIEQLVQDNSLAFRAEFDGALPSREQLYWRSYLYERFDGRRWLVVPPQRAAATETADKKLPVSRYRIIAEPSQQTRLYSLGLVEQLSDRVRLMNGSLVQADRPVSQRFSYQLSSRLGDIAVLSDIELKTNLLLPGGNEKTALFAKELRQQYSKPGDLIRALAGYFNQQSFYYSLSPPPLGADGIDQFLFDTRTGFCSHYASATAFILRHAGIPARVVGGYLGGDWHNEQGYLAVRQREAHAWVEYADNGYWKRFDPTASVAPERVLQRLDDVLSDDDRALLSSFWQRSALLQSLQLQLMHLDYYWSVWVLGFDDNQQQNIWRTFWQWFKTHSATLLYLVLTIGLLVTALVLWLALKKPAKADQPKILQLMQRSLKPLLDLKAPHQSLSAYLEQLSAEFPAHSTLLQQIKQLYEQAIFAGNTDTGLQLKMLLRQHKKTLGALSHSAQNSKRSL